MCFYLTSSDRLLLEVATIYLWAHNSGCVRFRNNKTTRCTAWPLGWYSLFTTMTIKFIGHYTIGHPFYLSNLFIFYQMIYPDRFYMPKPNTFNSRWPRSDKVALSLSRHSSPLKFPHKEMWTCHIKNWSQRQHHYMSCIQMSKHRGRRVFSEGKVLQKPASVMLCRLQNSCLLDKVFITFKLTRSLWLFHFQLCIF